MIPKDELAERRLIVEWTQKGRWTPVGALVVGTVATTVASLVFFLIVQPSSPWLETILELMVEGAIVGAIIGIVLPTSKERAIVGFLGVFLGIAFAVALGGLLLAPAQGGEFLPVLIPLLAGLLGSPAGAVSATSAVLTGAFASSIRYRATSRTR